MAAWESPTGRGVLQAEGRGGAQVSRELRGSEWLGQELPGDRKDAKARGGSGADGEGAGWRIQNLTCGQ